MAKEKVTVAISSSSLALLDADAKASGLNRSEFVERAVRNEHYRRLLDQAEGPTWAADDDALAREALRMQAEA
ncbi:ribbon-helix-helix domain-containing protein [Jiangella asiatica]|uniref:Ribbon-helix-helix protein, CopG family n=1 Tax=Jiangella asiatica TaxID=2530372 RepID=A0A4R5DAM0_9ACTN|nr:ribbon-helix-helix domain-containing protein [Jiangella asiatica]TDE10692.1 ribbon-helix-helix protein, CopG family [Jiangella asiatica]